MENQEAGIIYSKLIKIMTDIGPVKKDKTNENQGWAFRGVDDFMNALNPLFAKHGVIPIMAVQNSKREKIIAKSGATIISTLLDIKITLYAEDGSNVDLFVYGEAMDLGDKSTNKAMSYGFKYAMMFTFCIPTDDIDDGDKDTFDIKGEEKQNAKNDLDDKKTPQKLNNKQTPSTQPEQPKKREKSDDATQQDWDKFVIDIAPFVLDELDEAFIARVLKERCMYGELLEAFDKIKKNPLKQAGNLDNGNSKDPG